MFKSCFSSLFSVLLHCLFFIYGISTDLHCEALPRCWDIPKLIFLMSSFQLYFSLLCFSCSPILMLDTLQSSQKHSPCSTILKLRSPIDRPPLNYHSFAPRSPQHTAFSPSVICGAFWWLWVFFCSASPRLLPLEAEKSLYNSSVIY